MLFVFLLYLMMYRKRWIVLGAWLGWKVGGVVMGFAISGAEYEYGHGHWNNGDTIRYDLKL